MPKAKKSSKKKSRFQYNVNRKKLKQKLQKKAAPRIECPQIRNAWNDKKTVAQNLKEMGLSFDPNSSIPLPRKKIPGVATEEKKTPVSVKKPYVVKELEEEANVPRENKLTVSRDLAEYVQHMIREHNDDYKAMARDEKNYYQDTPKQIKRKVDLYKHCHPKEYAAFMESLKALK
ncbi:hypothetical protein Z043_117270 [Scleropages formosus]|nr:nucleolar protein 16 [Scleropages formosus]KPP64388.1 hypothetical protein Z043_117270 [Scleropages formosus]